MNDFINGRSALRPVDGHKAAGMCVYRNRDNATELSVAAQSFERDAALMAVAQYGPGEKYRCHEPEPVGGAFTLYGAMPAALWVLDGGRPVLFGRLSGGPFDQSAARSALPGAIRTDAARPPLEQAPPPYVPPPEEAPAVFPAPPSIPNASAPPISLSGEAAISPAAPSAPAVLQSVPVLTPAGTEELDAADVIAAGAEPETCSCDEPEQGIGTCSCDEPEEEADRPAAGVFPGIQEVTAPAVPFREHPGPEAASDFQSAQAPFAAPELIPGYLPPLVVRRSAQPTPHEPVYSPLWDDVSAEFEKLLDSLPAARPFAGGGDNARFSELPTGGAVQCYIGSVTVNGMRVYLQAVPARPYGRPAGFDHTLVSREGASFWVKYFISN